MSSPEPPITRGRHELDVVPPGQLYLRQPLFIAVALLVGIGAGVWIGRFTTAEIPAATGEFAELDAVVDVLEHEYYYRPLEPDDVAGYTESLQESAIVGMLSSLDDDYTRYLVPEAAQITAETLAGEYGGIGVVLKVIDSTVLVDRVGPDTPAFRAGVRVGDVVERIDKMPVASMTMPLDGADLRGPLGSTVELTVRHPGVETSADIEIVREAIVVHPVSYQPIDDTSYLWLRIDIFGDRTTQELDEALAWASDNGMIGIVLDLRGNGGGWVRSAQEAVGRFLDDDVGPAFYEDTDPGPGGMTSLPILNPENGVTELPVVILVDRDTASAAEIVAGSLRDYDRALVVGERTYGKGSVQRIYDFENDASFRVTVGEWFTPSHGRIQDQGIFPDVLLTLDDAAAGDVALETAIILLDRGTTQPTDLISTPIVIGATPEP